MAVYQSACLKLTHRYRGASPLPQLIAFQPWLIAFKPWLIAFQPWLIAFQPWLIAFEPGQISALMQPAPPSR